MPKQKLMAKVHILKKQAGFDDYVYREKLKLLTGKTSSKDLSVKELLKVINSFQNKAPNVKIQKSNKFVFVETECERLKKIFKLWKELGEKERIRDSSNNGLNNFMLARFNCEYHQINSTNPKNNTVKDQIIEALKNWLNREVKNIVN